MPYLNRASGREFINRLLSFGYIREHPEQRTGRGRPATQYVISGAAHLVAGMAYTGTAHTRDPAWERDA